MSKKTKSRKAVQRYNFETETNGTVSIDLNNYVVKCSVTGNVKKFYHKYLANMIQTKFDNNIDLFEQNYISREAAPSSSERKVQQLNDRINRYLSKIEEIKSQLASVESGN